MQVVDSAIVINTVESNTDANYTALARACVDTGSIHTILRQSDSGMVTDIKPNTLEHITLPTVLITARASAAQYHAILTNSSTDNSFVRFMHAAFGSPAISSFAHAIRHKFMPSLPRLTSDLLAANPPHTTSTALGHLDQIRQGQHSTKRFVAVFPDTENVTMETAAPILDSSINNHAYVQVFVLTETMHSDLTGKFPVTSFSGMQYIIISVLDGYVHVEAMKSRHHLEYIAAYKRTINFFSKLGRKPIFNDLITRQARL